MTKEADIQEKKKINQKQDKSRFQCRKLLKQLGPGLLISMAYLDPGNLAGDIDAGVKAKYSLIWVLLWSTLIGWIFQNSALILGMVTHHDLAQLCKKYYGKKTKNFLWIMAEIAIIGSDIQEVLGSAIALNIIFNLKIWIGVLLTVLNTLVLLLVKQKGMKMFEKMFGVLIAIMAISFLINLVFIKPKFSDLLYGTIVPSVPKGSEIAMIGLIGSVLMPHNLYLHSSLVNEQENRVNLNNKLLLKQTIMYRKMETGLSLLMSFFINLSVIATFAYYTKFENLDLLTAGQSLKSSFGNFSKIIWGIGLLASGQSSTMTGTLSGQYVMEGFVNIRISKFKRAFITRSIAIIPALCIGFLEDVSEFNNYLNVLQAIQLPFAIIPMLQFSRNKSLLQEYTMGNKLFYFLSVFSVLIVAGNYYTSIPKNINWNNGSIYLIIIVSIVYFIFMVSLIMHKFPSINQAGQQDQNQKQKQKIQKEQLEFKKFDDEEFESTNQINQKQKIKDKPQTSDKSGAKVKSEACKNKRKEKEEKQIDDIAVDIPYQ